MACAYIPFVKRCNSPSPIDPLPPSLCDYQYPKTPADSAAFFERTAAMLNESFAHGAKIGVESCVGTETPLSAPAPSGPSEYPCTVGPATCYQDNTARILPHTVAITSNENSLEWCAYVEPNLLPVVELTAGMYPYS